MRLPLIASFLCFPVLAFAQTRLWKRYAIADGLPANTITAIMQTPDEVMWLGSQSGLVRFDGSTFKKIAVPKEETQPYVQSILVDKQGNLWIGTRKGLWMYNVGTRAFLKQEFPQVSNHINDMVWNADSTIIYAGTGEGLLTVSISNGVRLVKKTSQALHYRVAYKNHQVYSICNSHFVRYDEKSQECDTLARVNGVLGFVWYEKEKCWVISGREKIIRMSEDGNSREIKPVFNSALLLQEQAVYADTKGALWFNTTDTLYCYHGLNDDAPLKYFWQKDNPGSSLHVLNRMYMSMDGSMWQATGGNGLAVFHPRISKVSFLPSAQLSTTFVWSMYNDMLEKKIVFGTHHNVAVKDKQKGTLHIIPSPNMAKGFIVTAILDFNSDYWYICTYTGGAWRLHKRSYEYSRLPGLPAGLDFQGMLRTAENTVLFCASTGIIQYDAVKMQATPFPVQQPNTGVFFCNTRLRNGSYFGGYTGGVVIYDSLKPLAKYDHIEKDNYLGVVFGVYESPRGDLFMANMSGALYKLDRKTNKPVHIELTGEPTIGYCFAELNDSAFLLTTNAGIVYYNHYTGVSKLLNKKNGLPFSDFDQFGISIDKEYFMASGPEGAVQINTSDLPALLTDDINLRVQHKEQVASSINIPAGTQSLTANVYAGMKQLTHTLSYQYTLQGLEEGWHTIEKGTEITYNYLPPGEYTLIVKATDPNNVVSPAQTSIPVMVVPLWHQTAWFKTLLILLAAGILILAVRYVSWLKLKWKLRRLEAEQKVTNERMRISRELHDNVGSQLTYLITGLEASEIMLKQEKTHKLTDNLEQLQQSARDSMQQLRDSIWALNKEDMTISVLAGRFKDWVHKMLAVQNTNLRFEVNIEQDFGLDAIKALNLFRLLQEAVHNSIKHADAREIFITMLSRQRKITCQVHDNGKGFILNKAEGNGLANMQKRAEECGATLDIKSKPGWGTTITVELNMPNG